MRCIAPDRQHRRRQALYLPATVCHVPSPIPIRIEANSAAEQRSAGSHRPERHGGGVHGRRRLSMKACHIGAKLSSGQQINGPRFWPWPSKWTRVAKVESHYANFLRQTENGHSSQNMAWPQVQVGADNTLYCYISKLANILFFLQLHCDFDFVCQKRSTCTTSELGVY